MIESRLTNFANDLLNRQRQPRVLDYAPPQLALPTLADDIIGWVDYFGGFRFALPLLGGWTALGVGMFCTRPIGSIFVFVGYATIVVTNRWRDWHESS